ncbi:hypothetical protein Vretimale_13082 [Volvox reticuliferus]|uniref:Endonuclease/exonuclease/phosphatase domain-containing protein n=1 Tax=Volvox reticuliferus TaxID=1737510 RepID=A0A8J4CQ73_9CHLO|nr:hypothetical protein Vretifemale_15797 [Volvox reticuliferus]GIM09189.1 hypothetical protein Vretimale_13082 [Volvox reticuliferus]
MSGPRNPPYPLPRPAEVLLFDFRPAPAQRPSIQADRPIKLVQWNIERGYKLDAVIQVLRELDADVLALQEIDIHCERSGWEDTGLAIAKALGLSYAFVCEFEELHSPLRSADTQGGGVHGNAILSKYDITDVRAIEHRAHPVDWDLSPEQQPHPLARKEPRHGRRLTAAATVHTHQGPLLVYSAHLECFCGALARMAQLSDLFRDTRLQQQQLQARAQQPQELDVQRPPPRTQPPFGKADMPPDLTEPQAPASPALPAPALKPSSLANPPPASPSPSACGDILAPQPPPPTTPPSDCPGVATPPQPRVGAPGAVLRAALMGDLNTLANGVARLSPHYCTDHLRWGSLGWFEAELLDKKVLGVKDPEPINTWAVRQGLPEATCRDLVNPGYEDPFNARTDITIDHPKYRWMGHSFMTGKLDWVLLRGCRVLSHRMGNEDYSASDHKWLQVEVQLL